jgi:O-antigen/teichoic acid export membrane protein
VFSKIRELSKNITVYGLGDVAVSIVSLFLLSVYVDYLSRVDYGVFGLLGVLEVMAKIVFRFGLDGSFMRFFYDCEDDEARRRLASTIFLFLLALNGTVLALLLVVSGPFAIWLLGSRTYTAALRLMLVNTFAIGFTFIPFHVLRMERRSVIFSLLTLVRSVMTIVLRLVFVIKVGLGVTGLYLADVVVTAIIMGAVARWFAPLIRPVFSRQVLRETLAFGLPRVPHAAAQQVLAVGDKFILRLRHVSVENIGIYSMAVSFGLTQKLFLSAFEIAWAPFYYATIREPDASRVFGTITTYAVAVLALLSAGLAAVGRETAALMTHGRLLRPLDPRWAAVDVVIVWTSLGVFFQGVYLLTSIGLNITKRTQYYPIATMTAAGANVALNFVWIPRYGMVGAAWANGAAYALQAALGYMLSQRFYRIEYEWGRLFRVCAAGVAAAVLGRLMPRLPLWGTHEFLSQFPDLLLRGLVVVAAFGGLLLATRFFHAEELARLRALGRGGAPRRAQRAPDSTEMAGEIVATDIEPPDEPDA